MTATADPAHHDLAPPPVSLGLAGTAAPLAGVRIVGLGAEFIAFALIARRLGPSHFGEISVAFIIARYAGLFSDWGASLGGSRLLSRADPDWASVRHLIRLRTTLSTVLAAAFVLVTLWWVPGVTPIAITVLCRGLNRDFVALGRSRGARAGMSSVVQGLTLVVATLALVHGSTLRAAAWAIVIGYVAGAVASIVLNRMPRVIGPGSESSAADLRRDPWVLLIQMADQFLATADTTMIVFLGSQHAAGIYAAVCRIPNSMTTAQGLIVVGLVPGVSRHLAAGGTDAVLALRKTCLRIGARVSMIVLLGAPVAIWLMPRIFGGAFASGRFALAILLLAVAVSAGTVPLLPIALGLGRDKEIAIGYVLSALVNVVANLIVIPRWSFNAAAVVMLISQSCIAATYLYTSRSGGLP